MGKWAPRNEHSSELQMKRARLVRSYIKVSGRTPVYSGLDLYHLEITVVTNHSNLSFVAYSWFRLLSVRLIDKPSGLSNRISQTKLMVLSNPMPSKLISSKTWMQQKPLPLKKCSEMRLGIEENWTKRTPALWQDNSKRLWLDPPITCWCGQVLK